MSSTTTRPGSAWCRIRDTPIDSEPPASEYGRTCAEAKADPAPDPSLLPDTILWDSKLNQVIGNVLEDNREGDLMVASAGTDVSTLGNCWDQNVYNQENMPDAETCVWTLSAHMCR